MLIYTPITTSRCQYIFSLVFREMMGLSFTITNDLQQFETTAEPSFAYAPVKPASGYFLQSHGLLAEKGVRHVAIDMFSSDELPAFFKTGGDFSFDLFAASFYLVSRYEEYLPSEKDQYGRFQAKNSLAFKQGFLELPVVNRWVEHFQLSLLKKYPGLIFGKRPFEGRVSIDIDVAYAFKGRSLKRNILAFGKDILRANWSNLAKRLAVLSGRNKDPFDSYDYLKKVSIDFGFRPLVFLLVPMQRSRYDKNISPRSHTFRNLVKELAGYCDLGVHPSFLSCYKPRLVKDELVSLESITGTKITRSRQHYLKWSIPETFIHLSESGIKEDYSMGYAELPGFRAGVCTPFRFYNVRDDKETELLIHPITYMEGSFMEDMQWTPEQSLDLVKKLVKEVRNVNGYFLCIWHNHTIGKDSVYREWNQLFEETLDLIKPTHS